MLLKKNGNPNVSNKNGHSLLSITCTNGHEETTRILLAHSEINPNIFNKMGESPLYTARYAGRTDIVKTLLKNERINYSIKFSSLKTMRLDIKTLLINDKKFPL